METSPPPTQKKMMSGKNRPKLLVNAVAAATRRNRRPHAAVDAPERKKPKQGKSKWPFKKTPEIETRKEKKIITKGRENPPGKSKSSAHSLFVTVSKHRRIGSGLRFSGGLLGWKRRVGCALRKWMSRGRRRLMGWAPRMGRRGGDSEIQRLMRNEEGEGEEEEEEERIELCKKRILMGDKCKALSLSGRLHYDENGVLLPEMLP